MKWVGLTGGIGSGKSTVSALIQSLGYPVIDADALARQVVSPGSEGLAEIVKHFGEGVLTENKELNRQKLGQIVFNDLNERQVLESITHPRIQHLKTQMKSDLETQGVELAFYDVPLLFEKNLEDQFDAIVVVYSDVEQQIARIKGRNNWTDKEIQERINSQIPLALKKTKADHIIMNTGTIEDLEKKVKECIQNLSQP